MAVSSIVRFELRLPLWEVNLKINIIKPYHKKKGRNLVKASENKKLYTYVSIAVPEGLENLRTETLREHCS